MSQGYAVLVRDLKKVIQCFNKEQVKELLEYVPMADNYCLQFHGCDNSENKDKCDMCARKLDDDLDQRTIRQFYKLECHYHNNDYYHSTTANLEEQLKRTHSSREHRVVVSQKILEKIKQLMWDADPYKLLDLLIHRIHYKKCLYDSSKNEIYEYRIQTHSAVKILDSEIKQWLDTMGKGYAINDKKLKGNKDPDSYESLYSTMMTMRQHLEMFKRDSKQCNYNTVNHNTQYWAHLH